MITQTLGDITVASIAPLMPELYLGGMTLALLVYGVYRMKKVTGFTTLLALLIIGFNLFMVACTYSNEPVTVMNGMLEFNRFTAIAKTLILISGAMVLLLADGWLREDGGKPFEFVVLVLLALLGMMFMVSSASLLALYMALEMSSLALYVLASFTRDHARSSEAGLKYFVLGALASGMMLFGISLVYGFAGSIRFDALASLFSAADAQVASKGVVVGMVLIMVGFCFKLSAVPFHMWTPDVYEGAPTPVTAFFATAPKVAALALFTRLMLEPFGGLTGQWQQVVAVAAAVSTVFGALAAIQQTNIKRLLAYSSIGHVGFMLMALAAGNAAGAQAVLVYLGVYVFMSAGMFGCVLLMKRNGHALEDIRQLSGLSQVNPLLAVAISIFMFSMAGIPPLAGFFGKMYAVLAALNAGLVWLAVVGVAASVIGCFYYLKIVKLMYFDNPAPAFDANTSCTLRAAVALGAFVTLLFFVVPTPLIAQAQLAAKILVP